MTVSVIPRVRSTPNEIDSTTGAAHFLTAVTSAPTAGGMGYLDGSLYLTDRVIPHVGGFTSYYGTIDLQTGVFMPVGLQTSANWFGFAADQNDGVFYTVKYDTEQLLKVTPGGDVDAIGPSLGRDLRGLTYDDVHNVIYAADYYQGVPNLYQIDPHTAAVTLVGSLGFPSATAGGDISLLYNDATGVLYAQNDVTDALYSVNTTTGYVTLIGADGQPVAGLAIEPNITITITGTDTVHAPVLTLPTGSVDTENGAPSLMSGAHVSDVDSGDTQTLSLTVQHGSLTPVDATLPAGVTVIDGDGSDGTLTVFGSTAVIDQLLNDGAYYTPNAGHPDDVLDITVHDSKGISDFQVIHIANYSDTPEDVADGTFTGVGSNDQVTITPWQDGYIGALTFGANGQGGVDWHFNASNNQLMELAEVMAQYGPLTYTINDATYPAATQTLSVSVGGPGIDQFFFNSAGGSHALVNFLATVDPAGNYTGEVVHLQGFTSGPDLHALTVADVLADLTTDSHGNAVVNLGAQGSLTFAHVIPNVVQLADHIFTHNNNGTLA